MLRKSILALSVFAVTAGASAGELNKSEISKKFQTLTPFSIKSVEKSPLAGTYQLVTSEGVFYMTKDGEHIISGSVHEASEGLPNLTKQRIAEESSKAIKELKDSFLTFEAPNEKHEIVVFYDSSCPYCVKLHGEVAKLNAQGVTVHYAGWPRQGIKSRSNPEQFSQSYKELESIWCSDSPKSAFDRAAEGAFVEQASCDTKIAEHFALGEQMGVRGTPAIYDINGNEVTRGYAPANRIVNNLEKL